MPAGFGVVQTAAAVLAVGLVLRASGYSTGLSSCMDEPGHGTSNSGAGTFTLELRTTAGATVTSYTAGQSYVVRLAGGTFRGFTADASSGAARSPSTAFAGSTGTLTPKTNSKASSSCAHDQMTHTGNADKTSAEFNWAAPAFAGFGDVSFWATVVTSRTASWHEVTVVREQLRYPDPERVAVVVLQQLSDPHSVGLGLVFGLGHELAVGHVQPKWVAQRVALGQPHGELKPDCECDVIALGEPERVAVGGGEPCSDGDGQCFVVGIVVGDGHHDCDCAAVRQRDGEQLRGSDGSSILDPVGLAIAFAVAVAVAVAVSAALRVRPSRLVNVTVVAGSVRVSFVLLPPDSRPGPGEGATPTAGEAALDLQRQVSDPSSVLRTGGGVGAAVDGSAGVGVVLADSVEGLAEAVREANALFDPSSFDHEAVLGPSRAEGVVMRWSILAAGVDGRPAGVWRAQFEWAVDSWASVGIRRGDASAGMSDVWALLMLPRAPSASGRVLEADLRNTTLEGVVPHGAQNLDLIRMRQVLAQGTPPSRRSLSAVGRRRASSEASGGLVWRADVERRLETSDSLDVVIEPLRDVRVLYAVGGGPSEADRRESMQYHGANRGERVVNLGTGKVALAPVNVLVLVHGSLMFLSWGVLLPVGALVARFARGVPPTAGPGACWFRFHWMLQTAGTLASLAGAGTAIALVAQSGGSHFGSLHKAGGLVVVLLGSGLAVLGMARPAKDSQWRPSWLACHRFGGCAGLLLDGSK
ncbi:hypothetical protein FNF28_07311 [Cafeteria roenbergensis]|uniref:Cytochrome b561 domain-containing protein n=1 Tax=Cafeteria roenbergensis TaxID=33653 RepID=A0A5A8CDM5_CAFRO|nr:hypothetical protein FNF28_07311 [Cafeteria roenbergensis]